MFNIKVIDKYKRNYPQLMDKITDRFLKKAGFLVEDRAANNAPVDSGNLRGSIKSEVKGNIAEIGTNVEYAIYQEYGTKKMKSQPYLRPALDRSKNEIYKMYDDEIQRAFR